MRKVKFKVVNLDDKSCTTSGNFSLTYSKGSQVTADPLSLGIFTFHTRQAAERFSEANGCKTKVKRVLPIGRGRTPDHISVFTDTISLKDWYHDVVPEYYYRQQPPPGTICYPAVKVLD